jgi:ATP-dependent DNA helicase RecG
MKRDFDVAKKLEELLDKGETETVEFKKTISGELEKRIGDYASALANEANLLEKDAGWIVVGVEDKTRRIVGADCLRESLDQDKLKKRVSDKTGHSSLEVFEATRDEKRLVLLKIPAAPRGIPISSGGKYWGRAGSSLTTLTTEKQDRIRRQTPYDWSAEICEGADRDDLDEEALREARDKFAKSVKTDISEWSDKKVLEKFGFLSKRGLTKGAILLLGKKEARRLLNPNPAEILWKLGEGEKAYEHFGPPFLLNVEKVFAKIRNYKMRFERPGRFIPDERDKYDKSVMLEALHNCIAHQDYQKKGRVNVVEYKDRVEFESVGEFFDGTPKEYALDKRTPAQYRNPGLVEAMKALQMIDKIGAGIRSMYEKQRNRFLPLPEYEISEEGRVKLVIYSNAIDKLYEDLLMTREDLEFEDVYLLDRLQKNAKLTKEEARHLKQKGLAEGRYPQLHLSKRVSQELGREVEYSKLKGFDDNYYRDLVLQFLEEHGEANGKDIRQLLWDKLPDILGDNQKEYKVRNLLTKMRKAGMINNIAGRGKAGGKWILDGR